VETPGDTTEPERLEQLWSGDFGQDYVARNANAGERRGPFWSQMLERTGASSALEVGCNVGGNLRWLAAELDPGQAAGVDVNGAALDELRRAVPDINVREASARSLPFPDASFDLVFTVGVLIHLPPGAVEEAVDEIVRCSARWVLCAEYASDEEVEVPYRGERGALFKRDYGALYRERHPELELVSTSFEPRSEGAFDDTTVLLFEKPAPVG
jgi:pseudaminic acid biosynthesis-associated methylase